MKIAYLAIAIPLLFCVSAADFSGRVVGISDGDTITVLHKGQGEKIRLYGIDAPEKGQAFGNRAKQFVSAMASKCPYLRNVFIQMEAVPLCMKKRMVAGPLL